MNRLAWIPEVYPPSGALAAQGFYKLLGRPRMDPLTVLVRETAQNSWDARQANAAAIRFGLVGRTMSDDQRHALSESVFTDHAKAPSTVVTQALEAPELVGLHIFDRGTKGLGGPTQADSVDPDGIYDWVDFVLNVGKENTAGHTGGTYGFGKTISYIVSQANAVVVHSQTQHQGNVESRLIACAIGDEFEAAGRLHTGRHWWGAHGGTVPEPAKGDVAGAIAASLGMPPFEPDDLGTNLLIIAPDFGERSGAQAMRFVAESVTWHLWPKLITRPGHPAMQITVGWEDQPIPVPSPEERPPLGGFANALRALDDDEALAATPGAERAVIRCARPKTDVGDLVTIAFPRRVRANVDDGHDPADADSPAPAAAFVGASHHVALIRSPELVVEYQQGPPHMVDGIEWAGVFRCRAEHDGKFAHSEPPTHDSWRPELLPKGPDRTIVNVGLRRISEAVQARWASGVPDADPSPASTARIADLLSPLVGAIAANGPGRPAGDSTRQRKAGSPRSASVNIVDSRPQLVGGDVMTHVLAELHPERGSAGTLVTLRVGIANAWARSADHDADQETDPKLRLASLHDGRSVHELDGVLARVRIMGDDRREIAVRVARGGDTSVFVDMSAEAIALEAEA